MHTPFPLQCWDVIAKLHGYNNIAKGRGGGDERKQNFPKCLKVFVWDCRLIFYFLHFQALIIQKQPNKKICDFHM